MVPDDNKRNLCFFEAPTMSELFGIMDQWQAKNQKRFASIDVQQDRGKFCCIALTNPSEVVIVARADVLNPYVDIKQSNNALHVKTV